MGKDVELTPEQEKELEITTKDPFAWGSDDFYSESGYGDEELDK